MRLATWFAACVCVLPFVVGCGTGEPEIGGKLRPKWYRSAVSLSPGATEIVLQKTPGVRLIGKTEACNYPVANLKAPIVLKGTKPNFELIAQIRPDLAVYDVDLVSQGDIDKLKELGIATFAFSGYTVADFEKSLYEFGTLVGGETEISIYVDRIEAAVDTSQSMAVNPRPKIAILMSGGSGEHMVAGKGSFQADVVRCAGGEPVGPEANVFVPMNAEALVALNPDGIVVAGDEKAVARDPRLQSISAVRRGRVGKGNSDILLRRGVRVDEFVRDLRAFIQWVAQKPGSAQ